MFRPRWIAQLWAKAFGYFWIPCPICHENFGGHEIGDYSLAESPVMGRCACRKPTCQTAARQSWIAQGFQFNP